eukprot:scaffold137132_cov24-Tisochrysis_lutea.AAC.1
MRSVPLLAVALIVRARAVVSIGGCIRSCFHSPSLWSALALVACPFCRPSSWALLRPGSHR